MVSTLHKKTTGKAFSFPVIFNNDVFFINNPFSI